MQDIFINKLGMKLLEQSVPSPCYTLDSGNTLRYFCPHLIETEMGTKILGLIGIYVVDFENYWTNVIGGQNNFMLSLYISNYRSVLPIPWLKSNGQELDNWASKVQQLMNSLPSSLVDLEVCREKGIIAGVPIENYVNDDHKFNQFTMWAKKFNR